MFTTLLQMFYIAGQFLNIGEYIKGFLTHVNTGKYFCQS